MRFVLIDRLLELEPGVRALASKTFAPDDEMFRDHFPGNPLVPGVLLLEAMAQTAGWLTVATTHFLQGTELIMVKDAKFRRPVRPGVELRLSATIVSSRCGSFELDVTARDGGELAASARVVLHTFDLVGQGERAEQLIAWAWNTFRTIGGDTLLTSHVASPTA